MELDDQREKQKQIIKGRNRKDKGGGGGGGGAIGEEWGGAEKRELDQNKDTAAAPYKRSLSNT